LELSDDSPTEIYLYEKTWSTQNVKQEIHPWVSVKYVSFYLITCTCLTKWRVSQVYQTEMTQKTRIFTSKNGCIFSCSKDSYSSSYDYDEKRKKKGLKGSTIQIGASVEKVVDYEDDSVSSIEEKV
jgi:hypothetical protein